MKPLGKLDKVALRDYWENEAHDFTPWLGEVANLKLLADTMGVGELELVEEERRVGDFRADLLAKNSEGKYVIVENQLEPSDHTHLGQIITYSSGLSASYVVWVAPEIRDEHRKAIDWLNSATKGEVKFFALEIELWRIGDSEAAPKFNVVCQPNEYEAKVKTSVAEPNPIYREFWEGFLEFCKQQNANPKVFRLPPPSDAWYHINLGVPKVLLNLRISVKYTALTCQLTIEGPESEAIFEKLQRDKEQIEAKLGAKLEWDNPQGPGKRGKILQTRDGEIESRDRWGDYFAWLKAQAEAFYAVFQPRIKELHLNDEDIE